MNSILRRPFVPTFAQQTLLYQLKEAPDKHLLFRAETGTGKSFIMAMWALNVDRSVDNAVLPKPTTTVLIIVPNPDLAIQYHYWISRTLSSSFKAIAKMSNLVQVFYRSNEDEEEHQEQQLREHPHPHIIISTPTRLLDLLSDHAERFDFDHLKYVMIDEADEIIQPPNPMARGIRHARPGETLLDWIWRKRAAAAPTPEEVTYPRLVTISSTLTYDFQDYMIEKFIPKAQLVSRGLQPHFAVQPTPRNKTDHFVVLLSLNRAEDPMTTPDRVVIQPALLPRATMQDHIRQKALPVSKRESPIETEYPPNYLAIPAMQRLIREAGILKALAIVPHGSSKADFVWACKYFGVIGAEELRFNPDAGRKGELDKSRPRPKTPSILVAFTKEIRGLDLKGIEMVFIMGEFGTVEDYVHITGRTGRHIGQHGAVVTMIEVNAGDVSQKLMNASVKIVRTGAKLGRWDMEPRIEMDLKALPGDEFEEIREKAGIVSITEEVRAKMERDKEAAEERKKWLMIQGIGAEGEIKKVTEPNPPEVQERFERPGVFGMNEESRLIEEEVEESVVDAPSIDLNSQVTMDWMSALSHSLSQPSPHCIKVNSEERVIIEEDEEEHQATPDSPDLAELPELPPLDLPTSEFDPFTEPAEPLTPFPSNPPFPVKQYRDAWSAIIEHQEKLRNGTTDQDAATSSDASADSAASSTEHSFPPEALIPNQAVPRREDVPIIPDDITVDAHSDDEVLQNVMEGESLRQAEEAHLLSPEIPEEDSATNNEPEKSKGKRGRPRKEPKKKTSGKRGRPRKNTQDLEA
jgi:superfamily II DNA/RNA helicase